MNTVNKFNNSYLQWAGGKGKLLKELVPVLESFDYEVFVEPFVGACNVALNVNAKNYVLNDLNKDLIASHNMVIKNPEEYVEGCKELFRLGYDSYYTLRDRFNYSTDKNERAILFQYLNKHGFNGLSRYNKSGKFNVPVGTVKVKGNVVPEKQVRYFSDRFKTNAEFYCESYKEFFDIDNSLVYCDPPYVPMTASNFNYTGTGFTIVDQIRLKDLAKSSGSVCLISNHWNSITEELYKDADDIKVFDVQRTISCKGSERVKVKECLVTYY